MARAHAASGADMVTVAVRRVNLSDRSKESLLDYIDRKKIFVLPNTAGCYSADEAVRAARLGREAGLSEWVKLEVIGDEQTLFPDTQELVSATKTLVKEGFVVLPYTTDDLIVARKLVDAGAAAVMPLGAPIVQGWEFRIWRTCESCASGLQSAADCGCGSRNGFGRGDCDGIGRGWRADEYGDCRGARRSADGGGDARAWMRVGRRSSRGGLRRSFTPPLRADGGRRSLEQKMPEQKTKILAAGEAAQRNVPRTVCLYVGAKSSDPLRPEGSGAPSARDKFSPDARSVFMSCRSSLGVARDEFSPTS